MSESTSGGFLSRTLGLGVVGCAVLICTVLAFIAGFVVALVTVEEDSSQNEVTDANDGFGSKDNPIPAGEWMIFDDAEVRPLQVVYEPDPQFEELINRKNPAEEGEQYVLVQYEIRCKVEECNTRLSLVSFWLVDENGQQWGEPLLAVDLKDDLDTKNASENETVDGWQVFTFPADETVSKLLVQWNLGSHLYALPHE